MCHSGKATTYGGFRYDAAGTSREQARFLSLAGDFDCRFDGKVTYQEDTSCDGESSEYCSNSLPERYLRVNESRSVREVHSSLVHCPDGGAESYTAKRRRLLESEAAMDTGNVALDPPEPMSQLEADLLSKFKKRPVIKATSTLGQLVEKFCDENPGVEIVNLFDLSMMFLAGYNNNSTMLNSFEASVLNSIKT